MELKKATVQLPAVLKYDPRYPAVPGYHVIERKRYTMVYVGVPILAVGYALTVWVTFSLSNQYDPIGRNISDPGYSLLPLAGPVIAAMDVANPDPWGFLVAFFYLPLAGMQWAGAILALQGPRTELVQVTRDDPENRRGPVLGFTANGLTLQF